MAETFIPFFERTKTTGNLPAYQFNHYSTAKESEETPEQASSAEESLPHYKLSKVEVAHVHPSRHAEKSGLRAKRLNDLKSAVTLSLPEEEIQKMIASLQQTPPPHGEGAEPASELIEGASGEEEGSESRQTTPQISLERDGDRITQIVIECVCGEVIALDCIY